MGDGADFFRQRSWRVCHQASQAWVCRRRGRTPLLFSCKRIHAWFCVQAVATLFAEFSRSSVDCSAVQAFALQRAAPVLTKFRGGWVFEWAGGTDPPWGLVTGREAEKNPDCANNTDIGQERSPTMFANIRQYCYGAGCKRCGPGNAGGCQEQGEQCAASEHARQILGLHLCLVGW